MMRDAILDYPKQLSWEPKIENSKKLGDKILVCAMGGSALASEVYKNYPKVDLVIHRDYDLPSLADISERVVVLSSYSGNTEEVLSAYDQAKERGYKMAVLSTGGKLLKRAQEDGLTYVQLPDTGIQPRMASGFGVRALAALFGRDDILREMAAVQIDVDRLERLGTVVAGNLSSKVPIVYASSANVTIAQNWKIKLNETGKVPSFYNVIPELNHNEMTAFDVVPATKALSANMAMVLLHDEQDNPRNKKRMEILSRLLSERGLLVVDVEIGGTTTSKKIFSSLMLGDFVALNVAQLYCVESEQVPMVEQFKKLI